MIRMKCQCLKRLRPMNGRNTHTHAHTHKKMTRKIQRRNHRHCELEFIFFVCSECLLLLIFCFMGQLTYATVSIFISTFLSLSLYSLSFSLFCPRASHPTHKNKSLLFIFLLVCHRLFCYRPFFGRAPVQIQLQLPKFVYLCLDRRPCLNYLMA